MILIQPIGNAILLVIIHFLLLWFSMFLILYLFRVKSFEIVQVFCSVHCGFVFEMMQGFQWILRVEVLVNQFLIDIFKHYLGEIRPLRISQSVRSKIHRALQIYLLIVRIYFLFQF
jgi:hypothetical protein